MKSCEQLSKKQHLLIIMTFFLALLVFSSLVLGYSESYQVIMDITKDYDATPANDVTKNTLHRLINMPIFMASKQSFYYLKMSIAFLVSILFTYVVKKMFQLEKKMAIIEEHRQLYFEQHLAIDEAAIWVETEIDGTIIFANPHFCRTSGYSREELKGVNCRIVKSGIHSPEFYKVIWDTISCGKVWRGEICNRTKDGHLYWLNMILVPILDLKTNKIKKYIGVHFDISEQKKAQEESYLLQKQLFHAQRLDSLGQLTGGIAHDFNNILMGISGYTSLALLINEKNINHIDQNKMATYLQGIENCSEKASDLVGKMLVYCRDYNDVELVEIDPATIILTEVIEMLRSIVTSCITIDFLANETPNILIAPTELNQIMTNLIINARDAIQHNSEDDNRNGKIIVALSLVDIKGCCDVCLETFNGSFVEVSVTDNGMGMPSDKLNRIFDPFFTTKEIGKGTGLGLSVVSGIVHNAGGHILVESEIQKGTRFRIFFPPVTTKEI